MGTGYIYWLKLKDDIFTSRRIKKLRSLENGDLLFIVYLKLQLVAMHDDGNLKFLGLEDDFSRELALEIDEPLEAVETTIQFLRKYGLAEDVNENTIYLPWAKINSQSETHEAEKKRAQRADKTNAENANNDVGGQCPDVVRQCPENVPENKNKSKRIDKETDLDNKSASEQSKPQRDYQQDELFDQIWEKYPSKGGDIRNAFLEYIHVLDSGITGQAIIAAIEKQKPFLLQKESRYIPSLEKWLRNKGWTDTAIAEGGKTDGRKAGKPLSQKGRRDHSEIPEAGEFTYDV